MATMAQKAYVCAAEACKECKLFLKSSVSQSPSPSLLHRTQHLSDRYVNLIDG